MKLKTKLTIRNVNVAVVLFILAFMSYILFAPLTPATYKKITVHNTSSLESGGTLTYSLERCRYVTENVPTQVIRNLIATDSKGVPLKNTFSISLSSDLSATPRSCGTTSRTVLLPSNIPAGYYRLKIIAIYTIIPIRRPSVVSITSSPFKVKPPAISEQVQSLNQQLDLLRQSIIDQGGTVPAVPSLPVNQSITQTPITTKNTITPSTPVATQTSPPTSTGGTSGSGSSGGSGSIGTTKPVNNPLAPLLTPLQNLINTIQSAAGLGGLLSGL